MYKRFVFLVSILLAGCQAGFIDFSHDLSTKALSEIPTGSYDGIAWIDKGLMAVVVDEGSVIEEGKFRTQREINILDITSDQLKPIPIDRDCNAIGFRSLQILPDQKIGYIFICSQSLNTRIIQEVDLTNGKPNGIYTESSLALGNFAYSPDMQEMILVDEQGRYLESSLYHLDASGKKTNITPDFLRADFPVWSQKNNQVAFLGTKPYPGSDDQVENFSQTESRLDYPWRIYLYNPESLTTKEFPLDIVHPSSLKWSPDGNMIAFSGEYRGIPGIWIVENLADPDNLTITKIVDGLATFDFSPDSKSIAFAYIGLENTEKQNILYVVDLGKMK